MVDGFSMVHSPSFDAKVVAILAEPIVETVHAYQTTPLASKEALVRTFTPTQHKV